MSVTLHLRHGDCVSVLREYPEGSIGAIVSDPPYGLEFMGKEWDKLQGTPTKARRAKWEDGGGFTAPGIGERDTPWPSFSALSKHGTANPTCAVCSGRLRGAKKCGCPQPHDNWKPIGKRKNPENEGLPDHLTGGGMTGHLVAMQEWHRAWLVECYRVLVPGGVVKAFSATRTFHRMAAAMEAAGFTDIYLEAWNYATGFPKSMSIGKTLDKAAGAEREVVGLYRTPEGGQVLSTYNNWQSDNIQEGAQGRRVPVVTAPATDAARTWNGWGTALKPSWEPVVVGTKPYAP